MGSRSTPAPLGKLLIVLLACSCYSSLLQTSYASADLDFPVSICQDLAPSPLLEQFVDKLPILKKIRISHGKQLTLGAYKIQQVSTPSLTFLLKIGYNSLGVCIHISLSLTHGVAPFWKFYGGFSVTPDIVSMVIHAYSTDFGNLHLTTVANSSNGYGISTSRIKGETWVFGSLVCFK